MSPDPLDDCGHCTLLPTVTGTVRAEQATCPVHGTPPYVPSPAPRSCVPYYCPTSDSVECCPEHSGWDVCCYAPERHRPVDPTVAPPASSQALPADQDTPPDLAVALLAAITGNQRKLAHALTAMSEHLTVLSEHLTVLSQAVEAQLELIGRAAAASSVPTGMPDRLATGDGE